MWQFGWVGEPLKVWVAFKIDPNEAGRGTEEGNIERTYWVFFFIQKLENMGKQFSMIEKLKDYFDSSVDGISSKLIQLTILFGLLLIWEDKYVIFVKKILWFYFIQNVNSKLFCIKISNLNFALEYFFTF